MARAFASGASQYVWGAWGGTSHPLTLACWFQATDLAGAHTLMDITDSGSPQNYYILRAAGNEVGDPVVLYANDFAASSAQTTAPYTANTWHHACGVALTANSRAVYLDGSNKGLDAVAGIDPAGMDRVNIGRSGDSTPGSYLDGRVAEAAIWNVALTDAEVAILAVGYSPLFVRPQNLVRYFPLIRDQDYELMNGWDLTPVNGPTITGHTRMIYPRRIEVGVSIATAGITGVALSGLTGLSGLSAQMGWI